MTDHSPAPWWINHTHAGSPEIMSGDHIIARVLYWSGSEDASEVYANARILGQALAMYELLLEKYDPTCSCGFCTKAREIISHI